MKYRYIDPQKIGDMLYDDPKYITEFCEAGLISFNEFIENFRTHLLDGNLEDLRKAGHKIKPGAQMMGADEVVEEYEKAKELLLGKGQKKDLKKSVIKMEQICATIKEELSQLSEEQN